jgi:hypothetical protein
VQQRWGARGGQGRAILWPEVPGDGEAFFGRVADDGGFILGRLFVAAGILRRCSTRGGRGRAHGWHSGGFGAAKKWRKPDAERE